MKLFVEVPLGDGFGRIGTMGREEEDLLLELEAELEALLLLDLRALPPFALVDMRLLWFISKLEFRFVEDPLVGVDGRHISCMEGAGVVLFFLFFSLL